MNREKNGPLSRSTSRLRLSTLNRSATLSCIRFRMRTHRRDRCQRSKIPASRTTSQFLSRLASSSAKGASLRCVILVPASMRLWTSAQLRSATYVVLSRTGHLHSFAASDAHECAFSPLSLIHIH